MTSARCDRATRAAACGAAAWRRGSAAATAAPAAADHRASRSTPPLYVRATSSLRFQTCHTVVLARGEEGK